MDTVANRQCVAFSGPVRVATGDLSDVVVAAKAFMEGADCHSNVLVFDAQTSEPVEIDFRGTVEDVAARYLPAQAELEPDSQPELSLPRAPGRPKLGVISREVTLLPRHWEWLALQSGSASVTLRRLVEQARLEGSGADRCRRAQDSAYRFMIVLAGNEPGFEEATRALYADQAERFTELTGTWPDDVRDHARELAAAAFSASQG
jgi:hypothetical protein